MRASKYVAPCMAWEVEGNSHGMRTMEREEQTQSSIRREDLSVPGEKPIDKVWAKAKKAPGMDSERYRLDPYGNLMFRPSYGKESPMGWEIDHIKPKVRGGSDDIRNLQALNTAKNCQKGDAPQERSRHCGSNK